jgi:sodium-type flagellar protein MotY
MNFTKVMAFQADREKEQEEETAVKYRYLFGLLSLLTGISQSAVLEYGASLDQSSWRLTADSALECRLEHFIPGYGSGSFVSRAGKQINLDFELRPLRPNARIQTVTLRSLPPRWRPGVAETGLGTIRFYKQFDGLVGGQTAWTMVGELEQGNFPAFVFRDWYHRGQSVQVSLSAVGFYARYQSFQMCLQSLLPYTFEDIAFTALNYEKNSDRLTPYSQRRLEMIGEYLKADPSIDMLVINAYTDSYGGRWPNLKLSEKRAKTIKGYFANLGIDPARIEVDGHGEKQHIASNETEAGRSQNRRVIISMSRFLPNYETRGQEVGGDIYTGSEPQMTDEKNNGATDAQPASGMAPAAADKTQAKIKAQPAAQAPAIQAPAIKAGPAPAGKKGA